MSSDTAKNTTDANPAAHASPRHAAAALTPASVTRSSKARRREERAQQEHAADQPLGLGLVAILQVEVAQPEHRRRDRERDERPHPGRAGRGMIDPDHRGDKAHQAKQEDDLRPHECLVSTHELPRILFRGGRKLAHTPRQRWVGSEPLVMF
jgi:hypothetical protein